MVGDSEDQKRWGRYHTLLLQAEGCERKSIAKNTPQMLRKGYLEQAQEARRQARHITM